MARVTVEDCVDKVPNRFELVLLAAHRARQISTGAAIAVEPENDKNPVIALREIAEEQDPARRPARGPDPLDPEERRGRRAGGPVRPDAAGRAPRAGARPRRSVERQPVRRDDRGAVAAQPGKPDADRAVGGTRQWQRRWRRRKQQWSRRALIVALGLSGSRIAAALDRDPSRPGSQHCRARAAGVRGLIAGACGRGRRHDAPVRARRARPRLRSRRPTRRCSTAPTSTR